jgi:hypothetical protein
MLRTVVLPAAAIIATLAAGTSATYALIGRMQQSVPGAGQYERASPVAGASPASDPGWKAGAGSTVAAELAELGQMSGLLQRSAAARADVIAVTEGVASCSIAPGAGLVQISQAVRDRQALLTSAASVPVSAIPDGRQLMAGFRTAPQLSVAADRGFTTWMRRLQRAGECVATATSDSSYLAGLQDSALAELAKVKFLQQWNPLAVASGQPTFSSGQI